jgi:hypothetical protein
VAVETVEQLKRYFETGDYPTQQQFWNVLESFIPKNSQLTVDNIQGLLQILQGKADISMLGAFRLPVILPPGVSSWECPGDMLIEKVRLKKADNDPITLTIGTTANTDDILKAQYLETGNGIVGYDFPIDEPTTIYFNGVTASTKIIIYRR